MKQVSVKFIRNPTNNNGTITYHILRIRVNGNSEKIGTILGGLAYISLGGKEIITKFAIIEGKLKL